MDAASGPIATAKSILRTMLSRCSALQGLDGAAYSESETLARVYLDGLPLPRGGAPEFAKDELEQMRPYAIVWMPGERAFVTRHTSSGGRQGFTPAGILAIDLFRTVPADEENDPAAATRSWENAVGAIIQSFDDALPGLAELSGRSGNLQLGTIELDQVARCHPDQIPTDGDYQFARILMTWGVDT